MSVLPNATLGNKNEHSGLKLDATDLENIKNGLAIYDKVNPRGKVNVMDEADPKTGKPVRYIEYCNIYDHLEYVRSTIKTERKLKHGSAKSFDEPLRLTLSIPPGLEHWLNKAYPKLFTDEVQTKQ